MARKRFSKEEKQVIAAGQPIEWQNVAQWHPATLISADIKTIDGWQHVVARTENATRTFSKGDTVYVSPGHIRIAS